MQQLEALAKKKMTRRQFLQLLVVGFGALFGLSALLGALSREAPAESQNPGYGKRLYGP